MHTLFNKYRSHQKTNIDNPIECIISKYNKKSKIFETEKAKLIRSCGLNHANQILFLAETNK